MLNIIISFLRVWCREKKEKIVKQKKAFPNVKHNQNIFCHVREVFQKSDHFYVALCSL